MDNKSFWYKLGYVVAAVAFISVAICILGIAIGGVVGTLKLLNWLWFI